MKLFSNTRSKRSTAWMMLLMWVFALVSGMGNACLLEVRGTHAHAIAGGVHHEVESSAHSAGHASEDAEHDGDSHDSKAPCLKACDDGALSLLKQSVGADLSNPGLAVVVAFAWPVAVAVPVVSSPRRTNDLRPLASELPIRIRYSRLAL